MITVDDKIDVAAPAEEVWQIVSEPATVITCVEGAQLGDTKDDGAFDVTVTVKLGPLRIRFEERVWLDLDHTKKSGTMTAVGRDSQRGTRTKATATFSVTQEDQQTTVLSVHADVDVTGKLASIIESSAQAVVKQMVHDFTLALQQRCSAHVADAGQGEPIGPAVRRTRWTRIREWWNRRKAA